MRILSLGFGVQSFTLAVMHVRGDIEPFDHIIHADTTHESVKTYEFIKKWTPYIDTAGVPIITLKTTVNKTKIVQKGPKAKNAYTYLPIYPKKPDGKPGKLSRFCTANWKITPVMAFLRKTLKKRYGYFKPKANTPPNDFVHQAMGISLDEYWRMKQHREPWIKNIYPLVDMRMTRDDCKKYLTDRNIAVPPKSACVFCPYRSPATWADAWAIPEDREKIKHAERELRYFSGNGTEFYLHASLLDVEEIVRRYNEKIQIADGEDPTCDSGYCFV